MSLAERTPIPLRPDRGALARGALRSVARACLHVCRNAGRTVERHPWKDDPAVDWLLTRAAVAPTTLAATQALTQVKVFFLPSLVPMSAAAAILGQSLQFSFDGAASISVPAMTLPQAGFLGESLAIPVLVGTSSAGVTLVPYKIVALLAMSHEMLVAGDAETIMTQILLENVGPTLDAAFFSNAAAVAGVSPAGILNGAISVTAAPSGQNPMAADIGALAKALAPVGASGMVIVAAPAQAAMIKALIIDPPPTYASNALADKTVVGIVPASIASANSTPQISASIETTLHMAVPASELVSSPGTVAAPQRGMFQTDSSALRFMMDVSWVRRGAGVAVTTGVNWP
jgi:hypothetical protein